MNRMGSEISRIRKEVGMTRKQLAKLVGVTEDYISDVESGKKVVNGDLATKISKAMRQEVGKLDLYEEADKDRKPEPDRKVVKVIEKPVQAVWNDALAGVLKAVPVFNYKMDKEVDNRQLPIIANKVEGCPKEKVFYLTVEDNEMTGFRISKGDMALFCGTQELEKDSVYLVELAGRRMIRQLRTLDGDKLLLVSNGGTVAIETAQKKDVKLLGRLVRLEISF